MSSEERFLDVLVQLVARAGGGHLFGVLGDANMFFVDAYKRTGGRYLAAAEEKAAVLMATGFARRSGRPGLATVTHGPGLANTMAALIDASRDKSPVLVIAGETPRGDSDHLQWLPQRALVESIGVTYIAVDNAEDLLVRFADAERLLVENCGPVVLGVPSDHMFQTLDKRPLPPPTAPVRELASDIDPDNLDAALGVLATSRRGVLLAGRGAAEPATRAALLRLADAADLDLATTLLAKDLFAGHPRNIGVFGTFATTVAIERIASADCVIAFGASLNRWTTADGSLLQNSRVIVVNDDVSWSSPWTNSAVTVSADAGAVANLMASRLSEAGVRERGSRRSGITSTPAGETPIDIYTRALDAALPGARTVVCDGGRFMVRSLHGIRASSPRGLVHTLGFGSIGLGLGNAVGAAVAAPDQPTVLLVGDGGLMLAGWSELHTIVRERLDVTIAVFNDSAYGAEHQHFVGQGLDPAVTEFDWPAFAEVAAGFGWATDTLTSPDDVHRLEPLLRRRDRPTLLDFRLDPHQVPSSNS